MYNGLIKHMGSSSFGKSDFWAGQRPKREQYGLYIDKVKARLQNHLKEPFQLANSPPLHQTGWNRAGKPEPGYADIPYRFTQDELATYKSLSIDKRAEFMTACKSKESCQNLLNLLALDHRYLTICDALPNHVKELLREPDAAEPPSVLRVGGPDDDGSCPDRSEGGAAGGTPPTPPRQISPQKNRPDKVAPDFRVWLPLRPHSVAWKDLGFSDPEAPDRRCFVPACAFFFFIPELPTKYPDVNNALHKHWHTKYKGPMKAADFDEAPTSFDADEIDWFKANVELMISRLSEDERAERGLSVTSAIQGGSTARTKALMQAKASAAAAQAAKASAAGKAAKASASAAKAQAVKNRTERAGAGSKRGLADPDEETSSESDLEAGPLTGRCTCSSRTYFAYIAYFALMHIFHI